MIRFLELQPCSKEGKPIGELSYVRSDMIVGVRKVTESEEVTFIRTHYNGTHYVLYRPYELVSLLESLANADS